MFEFRAWVANIARACWRTWPGKIGLFIVSTALGTVISTKVAAELTKVAPNIRVSQLQLGLSDRRYLYLVDIANDGAEPIVGLRLELLARGQPLASVFGDRPTLHSLDPEQKPVFQLSGSVRVEKTEDVSPFEVAGPQTQPVDPRPIAAATSARNARTTSAAWYDVALDEFALAPGESKTAAVLLSDPLLPIEIRVRTEKAVYSSEAFEQIASDVYGRINLVLSMASSTTSSRIYAEGIGLAEAHVHQQAKKAARDLALADLEAEIAKQLYGVKIEALEKMYSSATEVNDGAEHEYYFSTAIKITTEGTIDLSRLFVYKEIFENRGKHGTVCNLKGYYELPWDLPVVQPDPLSRRTDPVQGQPLVMSGAPPAWVTGDTTESSDYLSAVGVADASLPRALGLRVAANDAKTKLAQQLEVHVSSMLKEYASSVGGDNGRGVDSVSLMEHASNQITSTALKGATVSQYYIGEMGDFFALVLVPIHATGTGTLDDEVRESILRRAREAAENLDNDSQPPKVPSDTPAGKSEEVR